jgi:hypothetical protein
VYSQAVIERVLSDFHREKGWRPKMRSIDEVDELVDYIDSLVDMDANSVNRYFSWKQGKRPSDERIKWIRQQIVGEQFLCFASAEYFVSRYGRIRDVQERIIKVQFRKAQKIFQKILAHYDDLQIAIQLFFLKSRQVGISTGVALYFLHRILFRSNTHAIMASAQVGQSEKLGMMIETCWSRLPFWLPPAKTVLKEKEPRWANGSALSVQAGSQNVGIAQGSTPTAIHISEIADYATPKKTIEEGLFPAAHQTAALFFVMEGTGSTASPWQKEKWEYYTENWGKGGRFQPIFIPPACAEDIYPHIDWLKAHPIPESWHPMTETQRMKRRCELFVRSKDYLISELGAQWEMGREYQWFWECGYREAISSHSEKTFLAQNAVTPEDAFQSKWDPVFADETIEIVTKEREKSYQPYAITGKTILMGTDNKPYEPPTHEIDWDKPRIPLKWESNDGNIYRWELIPLLPFDDGEDARCFDKLLVFQEPREGADYAESIDTADGLNMPNEDRSALSMHICRSGSDRDEQVAAFTSIRANAAQMARIAAAVAVYFCTDGDGNITTSNPLGPKFIIEQTRKPGDDCQLALKIMGFLDHHLMIRYDGAGNIVETKSHKEGFYTSKWSRPMLLGKFVSAVTGGWFKPNCPILIRQLSTFVRKEKSGISEMTHETGQHDDNIFAAALAWFRAHHLDDESKRLALKYQSKSIPKSTSNYEWATNAVRID